MKVCQYDNLGLRRRKLDGVGQQVVECLAQAPGIDSGFDPGMVIFEPK